MKTYIIPPLKWKTIRENRIITDNGPFVLLVEGGKYNLQFYGAEYYDEWVKDFKSIVSAKEFAEEFWIKRREEGLEIYDEVARRTEETQESSSGQAPENQEDPKE